MTLSTTPVAYKGRADHVWPPFQEGWAEVPFHHDPKAVETARLMLGALPPYHYTDEALPTGLYRFFAFETPVGVSISALKFVGEAQTRSLRMGQGGGTVEDYVDSNAIEGGYVELDGGGALPTDNSQVTGTGSGSMGVKITAASYPTLQAAAQAMYNAIQAHGYVRADQAIYAGYQLKAGNLTVDAFPGSNTMASLKATLAGMSITLPSSIPIYPWLATAAGGATGVAAYDGVNAPTWAQWTGQGSSAPAVSTASVAGGSGGAVAALVAALVVVGGVIAKSQGVF
jgi:hypothetical protein